mgnify:CR=1 FL=1
MNITELKQLLDTPSRLTVLSTVDKNGQPNSAIFGSVKIREQQLVVGISNNRSLQNLRHNGSAALMVIIPGENILSFKGARLYLECNAIENTGSLLEELKAAATSQAGRAAGRMIQHAVRFDICEYRDLVDMSSLLSAP